ncbi:MULTISPECIES: thioredoxin family protein [Salinibacter]|jgi:thioredoxin-related protein|uniref:thioredoxin family protein n=1 Tax=Salinibacter TaxID=146918 RepID=UPI001ABBAA8F|nr:MULTISPECIES: thioredoxin family protein [Salinibacter]
MNENSPRQLAGRAALLALVFLMVVAPATWAQDSAEDLDWRPFEEALATAQKQEKPVLVDVWAPWCGWCHRMKNEIYPAFREELGGRLVLTRLNRDDNDDHVRYRGEQFTPLRLAQKLGVAGVPAVVFLAPNGQKLFRTAGFLKERELRPAVEYVGSGAYRRQSYEAFRKQRSGGR